MIELTLPFSYSSYRSLYDRYIIHMEKIMPERFLPNISISGLYGAPYGCIWSGMEYIDEPYQTRIQIVKNEIDEVNHQNKSFELSWTNTQVKGSDFENRFCNFITKIIQAPTNYIGVQNQALEKYLRKHYPEFKFCCVDPDELDTLDKINAATEIYDKVVLHPAMNHEYSILERLLHPEKVELIVDYPCHPYCQRRREHQNLTSQSNIYFYDCLKDAGWKCPEIGNKTKEIMGIPSTISPDEMMNQYQNFGINKFRVSARVTPYYDVAISYAIWLVRPEFTLDFISDLFDLTENDKSKNSNDRTLPADLL